MLFIRPPFRNLSECQLKDDDIGDITECIAEFHDLQDLCVDLESDVQNKKGGKPQFSLSTSPQCTDNQELSKYLNILQDSGVLHPPLR